MTDKEKEAIEDLSRFKSITIMYGKIYSMHVEQLNKLQENIDTILKLIEKQQKEIETLKDFKEISESKVTELNPIGLARANQILSNQCHNLKEELGKKEKVTDKMAQFIWEEDTIFRLPDDVTTSEEVKEYFKKKVEGK